MAKVERLDTKVSPESDEASVYEELRELKELEERVTLNNLRKLREDNQAKALARVGRDKEASAKLSTLISKGPSFYPGTEGFFGSDDHTMSTRIRAGLLYRGKARISVGVAIEGEDRSSSLKPVVKTLTTELPRTYTGDSAERITISSLNAVSERMLGNGEIRRTTIDLINGLYTEERLKVDESTGKKEVLSREEKKAVKDGTPKDTEHEVSELSLRIWYLKLLEKQAEIIGK